MLKPGWRLRILCLLWVLGGGAMALPRALHGVAYGEPAAGAPLLSGVTTFYTTTVTIPTYPYRDYLTTGYNATYHMTYPILRWGDYNAAQRTPALQTYTLLVLENDYLRVTLLPELGGRVYQLIYKATGHNELYQNPVLKPTGWGPPEQGWWLAAGGIEWCLPVEEHGYEWGQPWAWSAVTSTAGVTVTVRDTTATDRLRATVTLFLPADRGYLAVTPRLENPTGASIAYKYWTNAMLAPGPENSPTAGLRFIFNASQVTVHSTGVEGLPGPGEPMSWPLYNNRDYSRLGNWLEWLGFFERPQAAADFIGVYSEAAGEGVARVFPAAVARGAKGFAFGWLNPLPTSLWTDDGSGYVELHGGVAPTFWDAATLAAGATLSWTEFWYPVGAVGPFGVANAEAALTVRAEEGNLRLGVHPTAAHPAGTSALVAWERDTCALLGRWDLPAVDPAHPAVRTLAAAGRTPAQVAVAYVDVPAGRIWAAWGPTGCFNPAPRLALQPATASLLTDVDEPGLFTATTTIRNSGYRALTWTAELADGLAVTLPVTAGRQDEPLYAVVDTTGLAVGIYTGTLTVTATPTDVLDSPQRFTVLVHVVPEVSRVYLPVVLRGSP